MLETIDGYPDMTKILAEDIIEYSGHEDGKFCLCSGVVKSDNIYTDGVNVYGEGWRQYVGKWFIVRIRRDERLIWEDAETIKLLKEA